MQIYSPINDITEEEIDRFCRAKGQCKEGGDFLSFLFFYMQRWAKEVGQYGLDNKNKRGTRWINWFNGIHAEYTPGKALEVEPGTK